jgi:hypothetical protein
VRAFAWSACFLSNRRAFRKSVPGEPATGETLVVPHKSIDSVRSITTTLELTQRCAARRPRKLRHCRSADPPESVQITFITSVLVSASAAGSQKGELRTFEWEADRLAIYMPPLQNCALVGNRDVLRLISWQPVPIRNQIARRNARRSHLSPGFPRVAEMREPRCCGTASPCGAGIVSRRKLLLQRQPE